MFLKIRFQILVVFFVSGVSATEIGLDFFEAKIRPVLVDKCYGCHSVDAANRGKLKGYFWIQRKGSEKEGIRGRQLFQEMSLRV